VLSDASESIVAVRPLDMEEIHPLMV